MQYNPFTAIDERLARIENCLTTIVEAQPITGAPAIKKIVSIKQLCNVLDVTEPTILRLRKRGKIPSLSVGSAVRFDLDEVVKALNETRTKKG